MKILVLNGSPRKKGMVASLLRAVTNPQSTSHELEWIDVGQLEMRPCTACMACREKGTCALPEDDAHIVGRKIQTADVLVVGTPTHWGNMSAPLKQLFDRNVPVFMGESPRGIPVARQKEKRAAIVVACTTPWPFNFILPESRGAVRAVKEVLHYGGYRIMGTLTKPGTKKSRDLSQSLMSKASRLGTKLVER